MKRLRDPEPKPSQTQIQTKSNSNPKLNNCKLPHGNVEYLMLKYMLEDRNLFTSLIRHAETVLKDYMEIINLPATEDDDPYVGPVLVPEKVVSLFEEHGYYAITGHFAIVTHPKGHDNGEKQVFCCALGALEAIPIEGYERDEMITQAAFREAHKNLLPTDYRVGVTTGFDDTINGDLRKLTRLRQLGIQHGKEIRETLLERGFFADDPFAHTIVTTNTPIIKNGTPYVLGRYYWKKDQYKETAQ